MNDTEKGVKDFETWLMSRTDTDMRALFYYSERVGFPQEKLVEAMMISYLAAREFYRSK